LPLSARISEDAIPVGGARPHKVRGRALMTRRADAPWLLAPSCQLSSSCAWISRRCSVSSPMPHYTVLWVAGRDPSAQIAVSTVVDARLQSSDGTQADAASARTGAPTAKIAGALMRRYSPHLLQHAHRWTPATLARWSAIRPLPAARAPLTQTGLTTAISCSPSSSAKTSSEVMFRPRRGEGPPGGQSGRCPWHLARQRLSALKLFYQSTEYVGAVAYVNVTIERSGPDLCGHARTHDNSGRSHQQRLERHEHPARPSRRWRART
jgi:hypothetical protein